MEKEKLLWCISSEEEGIAAKAEAKQGKGVGIAAKATAERQKAKQSSASSASSKAKKSSESSSSKCIIIFEDGQDEPVLEDEEQKKVSRRKRFACQQELESQEKSRGSGPIGYGKRSKVEKGKWKQNTRSGAIGAGRGGKAEVEVEEQVPAVFQDEEEQQQQQEGDWQQTPEGNWEQWQHWVQGPVLGGVWGQQGIKEEWEDTWVQGDFQEEVKEQFPPPGGGEEVKLPPEGEKLQEVEQQKEGNLPPEVGSWEHQLLQDRAAELKSRLQAAVLEGRLGAAAEVEQQLGEVEVVQQKSMEEYTCGKEGEWKAVHDKLDLQEETEQWQDTLDKYKAAKATTEERQSSEEVEHLQEEARSPGRLFQAYIRSPGAGQFEEEKEEELQEQQDAAEEAAETRMYLEELEKKRSNKKLQAAAAAASSSPTGQTSSEEDGQPPYFAN